MTNSTNHDKSKSLKASTAPEQSLASFEDRRTLSISQLEFLPDWSSTQNQITIDF
jgi:hypothetical protein